MKSCDELEADELRKLKERSWTQGNKKRHTLLVKEKRQNDNMKRNKANANKIAYKNRKTNTTAVESISNINHNI